MIALGLIYQIIVFFVGSYGALKERVSVMLIWTGLGAVSMITNGVLLSWGLSALTTFSVVLNTMFAYMLWNREEQGAADIAAIKPQFTI